jgi:hypothetical protein
MSQVTSVANLGPARTLGDIRREQKPGLILTEAVGMPKPYC